MDELDHSSIMGYRYLFEVLDTDCTFGDSVFNPMLGTLHVECPLRLRKPAANKCQLSSAASTLRRGSTGLKLHEYVQCRLMF